MNVSALIITLNEERNIGRCLSALKWCEDIVVLDSFSTDGTQEIALKHHARFHQRRFDDYATQRNFGIRQIDYATDWILMVDADEVVSANLADEIRALPEATDNDIVLYRMRRKDFFMGRWLRFSSGYPTWFGRLVKTTGVEVRRAVNEEYHALGDIGYLKHHLWHYPFRKGLAEWVDKHNRYSTMEAENLHSTGVQRKPVASLLHSDPVMRRKHLKALLYHMPFRPFLVFAALFFIKKGFLDGKAGFTFCMLKMYYEFLIDCKVAELAAGSTCEDIRKTVDA